jgi:hypothetical protein
MIASCPRFSLSQVLTVILGSAAKVDAIALLGSTRIEAIEAVRPFKTGGTG